MADCQERDPALCELYLVEGDSAGGSAKQARDRGVQAVLPLRGKILNVEKARFDKMLSNEEIKMMISALGVGIGKDETNIEKARYHKVIIMTDADIDGSHIRTLLLTFFYRQLPQLIEKGYVYIAQPPLYRVKSGKEEVYLKDERSLTKHLTRNSLKKISVKNLKDPAANLEDMIMGINSLIVLLDNLSKKFDKDILKYLLFNHVKLEGLLKSEEAIEAQCENLQKWIKDSPTLGITEIKTETSKETEYESFSLSLAVTKFGLKTTNVFNKEFADSTEWLELREWLEKLEEAVSLPMIIETEDGAKTEFTDYIDFYNYTMEVSQKGLYIQRYKGLGEMNPDQLWETTLNPENRTLLRVTIEDAMSTDETFGILMGEQVEPRRKFINDNALLVRELDV